MNVIYGCNTVKEHLFLSIPKLLDYIPEYNNATTRSALLMYLATTYGEVQPVLSLDNIRELANLPKDYTDRDVLFFYTNDAMFSVLTMYKRRLDFAIEEENLEYNPIENYDRIEETTKNNVSTNQSGSVTTDDFDNQHETTSFNHGKNTVIDLVTTKKKPIDGADFISTDIVETQHDESNRTDNTSVGTDAYTDKHSTDMSGESKSDDIINSRIHGNIGVTTAAQMIEAERELRSFSIWKYICSLLISDYFMIRGGE